jgi:uncharacterized protein YdaU (DUF1376 family)
MEHDVCRVFRMEHRLAMHDNTHLQNTDQAKNAAPRAPRTKERFPYFKFYPRDWLDATRNMTLEERGAYIDIIALTMEQEGGLRDDDKWIAHNLHIGTRKWRPMKARLIEAGKIRLEGGLIIQERCLKELEILLGQRRTKVETALNRESTKRENFKKPNENNESSSTDVPLRALATDSDLDLEVKDSSSLRSDSAATASPAGTASDDRPADKLVWGPCAEWMIKKTGKPDRTCKSLIGKWLKVVTHAELLAAFRSCREADADPGAYIGAIVSRAERVLLESCRRENGRLVVVNGFRAEIETILAGRDLQRSLDLINGKIGQAVVGVELEARVRSLAIEMVDRTAEQDRRYLAAAAQRAAESRPQPQRKHKLSESARALLAEGPIRPREEATA